MFSAIEWYVIAISVFCLTYGLVQYFANGYGQNKESFLLSLRNITPIWLAISLGMAWANSPSFWVASGQAYNVGLVGWFWFSIGNIATLAVFGYAAQTVRKAMPDGYTLAGYFKTTHGILIHKTYVFCSILIALITACIALSAISTIISMTSDISRPLAGLLVIASAIFLSYRVGFRATALIELIKFATVVVVFGSIITYLSTTPTISSFANGLAGIKGNGNDIFGTVNAWTVFATFGIVTFLGQLSAPWVDNNFIQRAFAYKGNFNNIWKSYVFGALVFSFVCISCGVIAFFGVANAVPIEKGFEQYAMMSIVNQLVGHPAAFALGFLAFISCLGIVDDQISNINSLVKNDILSDKYDDKTSLFYTRLVSAAAVVAVMIFINLSWVNLLYFLLLGNIARCSIGSTTVGLIFRPKWFDGNITGIILLISFIITAIGFTTITLTGMKEFILPLTLASVFLTPTVAILLSYWKRK